MKYLLCLSLFLSLALVPTSRAVAAPAAGVTDAADCQAISLTVIPFIPGEWFIGVANPKPTEPWMLFHGTETAPTNYMGCTFYCSGTVVGFGPYTGGFAEDFPATHAQMVGCWQILSATQTSNRQVIAP